MRELRQYHPNLKSFTNQADEKWLDFDRRYSQRFCHPAERTKKVAVLGKKVKVSLPKSYHSADAKKEKILVFKGVSSNITSEDFKETA